MPDGEKKGITVRIDAGLHAEVSQYLKDHGMTMAEFVTLALDDELHPKMDQKEGQRLKRCDSSSIPKKGAQNQALKNRAFQIREDVV